MVLSEKLAALRKEHGYSQLYVAERLNVSRQAISRWEVGSSVPSTENLMELSRLYGVSLDGLVSHDARGQAQAISEKEPVHQKSVPQIDIVIISKKKLYITAAAVCLALLCLLTACLWRSNRPQDEDVVNIDSIQNEGIVTPDETFEFE